MKNPQDFDSYSKRLNVEECERWRILPYTLPIPFLSFDADWIIKIIPPYMGAVTRFIVAKKDNLDRSVSVYLDVWNRLGFFHKVKVEEPVPYWEIYNFKTGETYRFELADTDNLLDTIKHCLND